RAGQAAKPEHYCNDTGRCPSEHRLRSSAQNDVAIADGRWRIHQPRSAADQGMSCGEIRASDKTDTWTPSEGVSARAGLMPLVLTGRVACCPALQPKSLDAQSAIAGVSVATPANRARASATRLTGAAAGALGAPPAASAGAASSTRTGNAGSPADPMADCALSVRCNMRLPA